ncbi:hypothetical protein COO60DRAFT_916165 [Scenedesmus sp. NREL 46B-D3]|nr:hypothetical protein COO60DRAFT_916165 [Scenedesmus sp. NREL 46B-D3]
MSYITYANIADLVLRVLHYMYLYVYLLHVPVRVRVCCNFSVVFIIIILPIQAIASAPSAPHPTGADRGGSTASVLCSMGARSRVYKQAHVSQPTLAQGCRRSTITNNNAPEATLTKLLCMQCCVLSHAPHALPSPLKLTDVLHCAGNTCAAVSYICTSSVAPQRHPSHNKLVHVHNVYMHAHDAQHAEHGSRLFAFFQKHTLPKL